MGGVNIYQAIIVNWFKQKRSLALGLLLTGGSVAAFLVPVIALFLDRNGWRATMFGVGLIILGIGIPMSLFLRRRPQDHGLQPDGLEPFRPTIPSDQGTLPGPSQNNVDVPGLTVAQALVTYSFWCMVIANVFNSLSSGMVFLHLAPALELNGFSTSSAASVVTIWFALTIPSRLILGWIGDKWDKKHLAVACYLLLGLGMFCLAFSTNYPMAMAFALLFGFGHGGIVLLNWALMADYMGPYRYGTISGLFRILSLVGGISGPVLAGALADKYGDYKWKHAKGVRVK